MGTTRRAQNALWIWIFLTCIFSQPIKLVLYKKYPFLQTFFWCMWESKWYLYSSTSELLLTHSASVTPIKDVALFIPWSLVPLHTEKFRKHSRLNCFVSKFYLFTADVLTFFFVWQVIEWKHINRQLVLQGLQSLVNAYFTFWQLWVIKEHPKVSFV